jgi:hypothetical protein
MIMQTIAQMEAAGTLTFHQALEQVTALALSKLPTTLHDRLDRARTLVEVGHVWLEEDGQHASVRSLDDARWHAVNAQCDCEDAAFRAEGGLCQHRLARMVKKLEPGLTAEFTTRPWLKLRLAYGPPYHAYSMPSEGGTDDSGKA